MCWNTGPDPESGLSKYLPSADVAWMALGWMPLGLAAIVWYLIGVGSWFGLLIGRYLLADLEPVLRRRTVLVAGLLAALLAIDGFCLGSFHVFMVWFMVAGLGRIAQNRNWSGGGLLGLAIWISSCRCWASRCCSGNANGCRPPWPWHVCCW